MLIRDQRNRTLTNHHKFDGKRRRRRSEGEFETGASTPVIVRGGGLQRPYGNVVDGAGFIEEVLVRGVFSGDRGIVFPRRCPVFDG